MVVWWHSLTSLTLSFLFLHNSKFNAYNTFTILPLKLVWRNMASRFGPFQPRHSLSQLQRFLHQVLGRSLFASEAVEAFAQRRGGRCHPFAFEGLCCAANACGSSGRGSQAPFDLDLTRQRLFTTASVQLTRILHPDTCFRILVPRW